MRGRQLNLAFVFFCVYFVLLYIVLRMHVCFCCVRFSFSVLSQEIGWAERVKSDLFCVSWDVRPRLSQSILITHALY